MSEARTGAVFPCLVSQPFRILQSDVTGHHLPQSGHDCHSPLDPQRSQGSRWVGKSVERRPLPLSDTRLRVSLWFPHQRRIGSRCASGRPFTRSAGPKSLRPLNLPPSHLPRAPIKITALPLCLSVVVLVCMNWLCVFSVEFWCAVQCSAVQ